MPNHTYRLIDVVGTSATSVEEAITNGVAAAAKQGAAKPEWFEVIQVRGYLGGDTSVQYYQVELKVGARSED